MFLMMAAEATAKLFYDYKGHSDSKRFAQCFFLSICAPAQRAGLVPAFRDLGPSAETIEPALSNQMPGRSPVGVLRVEASRRGCSHIARDCPRRGGPCSENPRVTASARLPIPRHPWDPRAVSDPRLILNEFPDLVRES